jgi:hypothetical protein
MAAQEKERRNHRTGERSSQESGFLTAAHMRRT